MPTLASRQDILAAATKLATDHTDAREDALIEMVDDAPAGRVASVIESLFDKVDDAIDAGNDRLAGQLESVADMMLDANGPTDDGESRYFNMADPAYVADLIRDYDEDGYTI